MRRIDVIGIGLGILVAGGGLFLAFRLLGVDSTSAGIWSQVVFVGLLMIWVISYVFRAATGTMTYNQQLDNYEDAVLRKRLEAMSPEELATLQSNLDKPVEPLDPSSKPQERTD